MELRHLRYFVAVAEALSFTRAAARLRLTQPALSRQVGDLEGELGCRLLIRGLNARTELTPEGRLFLVGARELLAAAEKLASTAREHGARLRFGHFGPLWLGHFAPVLRRFAKQHPAVTLLPVELTPRELAGALRRGDVDLALVGLVDAALRREFHTRQVAAYPVYLVLAATHPLAKRRRLRLAELRDEVWATWDEREFPGRKALFVAACQRVGFTPRIALETDSMASLFMHVATSRIVGHVMEIAKRLPHEGVVFSALDPVDGYDSELQAAWRRNDPREAVITGLVEALATFGMGERERG